MLRAILGVIVGFVFFVLALSGVFTVIYLVMGAEGAFQPGTFEISNGWLIATIGTFFVVGIVSGYVCAVISKSAKTPIVMAGILLALFAAGAAYIMFGPERAHEAREGSIDNLTAMQKAFGPVWLEWTKPVLVAAGCILGSRLKKQA